MVSDEALKKLQEQIAAWPMVQRFVVQQLIEDYRRNLEDLRAYEATGLTAAEVAAFQRDWSSLCTVIGECGGIDRVKELAEADRDGRVILLPCKPGTPIYRVQWARPVEANQLEVKEGTFREPFVEELGRNIFFTREDAEKRVEAENERLRRKNQL